VYALVRKKVYRALFGCSDSVREKRRIGRGVVVDLRFLKVKEDRKSSVLFKFHFFSSASKQRVRLLCFCYVNFFRLGLSCLRFLETLFGC
jgi:hypothetical protein